MQRPEEPSPPAQAPSDLARLAEASIVHDLGEAPSNSDAQLRGAITRMLIAAGTPTDQMERMRGLQRDSGLLQRPWNWLVGVAERALEGDALETAARAFLFANLWTAAHVPRMDTEDFVEIGLGPVGESEFQLLAISAIVACERLPADHVVQGDATGTIYPPMLARWAEGRLPADVLATLQSKPGAKTVSAKPGPALSERAVQHGSAEHGLKLGGLYISVGDNTCQCLRFLEDGVVVGAGVQQRQSLYQLAKNVSRWLYPDCDNAGTGVVRWDGGKLNFSLVSNAGVVDYEGEVHSDALALNSHSRINGDQARSVRYSYFTAD